MHLLARSSVVLLFAGVIGAFGCSSQEEDTADDLSPVSARPQQVHTPRGTISVPGQAFLDGREEDPEHPLTVMAINVWSFLPGGHVVCQLPHGDAVQVRSRKLGPRLYLEITGTGGNEACSGWVAAVFVGPEAAAPVGDRM